jgi:hypothetical protein
MEEEAGRFLSDARITKVLNLCYEGFKVAHDTLALRRTSTRRGWKTAS